MTVRSALEDIMTGLCVHAIAPDDRATIEIVLAEAMNNVVEHAYGDGQQGPIEVWLHKSDQSISCKIMDRGAPMKDERVPVTKIHDLNCTKNDLPEGGFGWSLIRDLTTDIRYTRHDDCNFLDFRFALKTTD